MVASFLSPHVGFACGGKFLFSGEDRYRTHFMCVWFWELMKQELFAVFQPLLVVKVFAEQQMCLCLVCDGLFCFVACCWVSRATRVLFYRSPLVK